jgi:hypothetical protein
VILSSGAVKVREKLESMGSSPVQSADLVGGFHSGKQLMGAIGELSRAGLVRMEGDQVWLVEKQPVQSRLTPWRAYLLNGRTGFLAVLAFGWFLFAQILSPEKTCAILPAWASDWLQRCMDAPQ